MQAEDAALWCLDHPDNWHFTISKSEDAKWGCLLLLPPRVLVGLTQLMKQLSQVPQLHVEGTVDSDHGARRGS